MAGERSDLDRTGNVFGAVALAVVDRVSDAVASSTDQSESAAVGLSALHYLIRRPSIDTLRRVLGLTSSGAVRLVDRLAASGYVERREGDDAAHDVRRPHAGRADEPRPGSPRRARTSSTTRCTCSPSGQRADVGRAPCQGRGGDDARAGRGAVDVPPVRYRRVRPLRGHGCPIGNAAAERYA